MKTVLLNLLIKVKNKDYQVSNGTISTFNTPLNITGIVEMSKIIFIIALHIYRLVRVIQRHFFPK